MGEVKNNNFKLIPDEAFQRGAKLIEFTQTKLNKKQIKQKELDIENKKTELLFTGNFTQKDFDNFVKYYNYKTKIKCPYCGKSITDKVFARHLKKHDITKEQFSNEYGGTSLIEMTAHKIMQWYSPNIRKWALQGNQEDIDYITFSTEKQLEKIKKQNEEIQEGHRKQFIPLYLDLNIIKGHLNRNHALSIYPWGEYAGWICLDVDTGEEAKQDTEKIVNTMVNYGIPRKNILVTYSGNKGYHIELFFQYPMKYKQIEKFGNKICFLAGNKINKKRWNEKIEVRPTAKKGIKLSLGINQKTGKNTRILNDNFEYFEHEYQDYIYFLNIDKIDNELIYFICRLTDQPMKESKEEETNEKIHNKQMETKNNDIEEIYENEFEDEEYVEFKFAPSLDFKIRAIENKFKNGLRKDGTRNKWAFQIAVWFRDILNFDKDKAEEELIKWTKRNLDFIKNENNAIKNASEIVKCVYSSNKYNIAEGLKTRTLYFSKEEIRLIKKIQRQGKKEMKAKTNAPSLLYFTFVCLAKYYGSNPFYISKNDLLKYSGLADKTLYNWLNWLKNKKYIEVVEKGNSYTSKATTYFISSISVEPIKVNNEGNIIFINIEKDKEIDIKNLYYQLIK